MEWRREIGPEMGVPRGLLASGAMNTYNLFAVPVKGGFDKQGPKGKAQRVIRVGDAGLPARGAGLEGEKEGDKE